ncbi:calcium-binding protein [Microvirga sp. 2YAF29]|uniref:calcium-binding protein n=1 Tax=Microvirga sp. 2YAF29 TaxID=3233031 RepID=UPI003F9872BC
MAITVGNDTNEEFILNAGVVDPENIFYGMGGNDTFIVNAGVTNADISGTNNVGEGAETQWDVVKLLGSASFNSINAIDVLTFGDATPSTTLTYNANSSFGVSQVVGSAAGIDTIVFTSGSEAVNLDLSRTAFVNWSRPNQTILVNLNTNPAEILDDRFFGSAAGERVTAGNGRDLLYGNAGDDYLDGGDGIDVLDGGEGDDTLIGGGGEGPNILKGGNGNDVYKYNEKVDIIIDTGGLDAKMVAKTTTMSSKDKLEGLVADEIVGGKTINLTGNVKANLLIGHAGKNTLKGMNGNDILEGRDGNDQLDGGAGNDKLYGGLGADKLMGGVGKDTFYFDTALSASNVDKVSGFSTRDDQIGLDHSIFAALTVGKLASAAFHIGSKAKDAGDRIIYNKSNGALYYDADGSGTAAAAIKFATLDKNLKMTYKDFFVI